MERKYNNCISVLLNKNFKMVLVNLLLKDIKDDYISDLLKRSGPFPNLKVIWDCGNGATGEIISKVVKKIPGKHKVLFDEIDGNFPNHHPDPTIEKNLIHLKNLLKNRKCGFRYYHLMVMVIGLVLYQKMVI